jgi:hypothetical protein
VGEIAAFEGQLQVGGGEAVELNADEAALGPGGATTEPFAAKRIELAEVIDAKQAVE